MAEMKEKNFAFQYYCFRYELIYRNVFYKQRRKVDISVTQKMQFKEWMLVTLI